MKLDTEDLAAIRGIVEQSFGSVPAVIMGALHDGMPWTVVLPNTRGVANVTARVQRKGSTLVINWELDGQGVGETLVRTAT